MVFLPFSLNSPSSYTTLTKPHLAPTSTAFGGVRSSQVSRTEHSNRFRSARCRCHLALENSARRGVRCGQHRRQCSHRHMYDDGATVSRQKQTRATMNGSDDTKQDVCCHLLDVRERGHWKVAQLS